MDVTGTSGVYFLASTSKLVHHELSERLQSHRKWTRHGPADISKKKKTNSDYDLLEPGSKFAAGTDNPRTLIFARLRVLKNQH